jgi:hypothetical protein
MPRGLKNSCGCRRRRRRTVPDEDRGRGNRRLPLQSCGLSTGTVQETDRPAAAIAHYNEVHPHKALAYRSPREFIAAHARP